MRQRPSYNAVNVVAFQKERDDIPPANAARTPPKSYPQLLVNKLIDKVSLEANGNIAETENEKPITTCQ